MLGQVLYTWLAVVGVLDAFLVAPALGRAFGNTVTVGRLLATLAVLGGLVTASVGRLFATVPLTATVAVGLILIDVGLLGYALYLPERGLLHLLRSRRQQ